MKYLLLLILIQSSLASAQILNHKDNFSRQDSLRGNNNEFRNWWNVLRYDIEIEPVFQDKFIKGKNTITFSITDDIHNNLMQIDLQQPMTLNQVALNGNQIQEYYRDGNVYFINVSNLNLNSSQNQLELEFSGHPQIANNPPWDGGWIFTYDQKKRPWMSVACQGLGASVWFPNKDYLGDEPEYGASLAMTVPEDLIAISNGRLVDMKLIDNDKLMFKWEVKNPINNYNIVPYIGYYTEIKDEYLGENGKLDLRYWVLDYNRDLATAQFKQTHDMLNSFEYWFGPYPFYEDSFKIVEAPHLGMEHQSAIAYGNDFKNGYLQRDLSSTGWGLKWDFILVHESGHEWFGNNITNQDVADMWIHESFTAYSEALHTEQLFGKEAGNDYVIGTRSNILNDKPMIGAYGVNQTGSGDIYYKGANVIHTLRQLIENDELFREILRGLNQEFYHQTVTTQQIENYISQQSKIDLKEFFDQYLRTTQIPILEYKIKGGEINYRWTNVIDNFDMPIKVHNSSTWLFPIKDQWKSEILTEDLIQDFKIDRNFYVQSKKIN